MSLRSIPTALAVSILAAATLARADTVWLKNGDQLSGTISQIEPTSVKLTSPVLGNLSIPRAAIKSLRSDAGVPIMNDAGQSHTAFVGPGADGAAFVESPAVIPPAPVVATSGPAAPAHASPNLQPYFLPIGPDWKNQLAIGFLNTTGNTESTQFTGEVDLNYKAAPSEFNFKVGGGYGQTNGTHDAQFAFLDAIYRRDMPEWGPRWFVFAESHELYDAIKGISFRSINDLGPGYYLWKGKKLNVDLRAGPGVTYVKHFDGGDTTDLTGMAGLRAVYTFNDRLSASEDLLYTNGLTNIERYQIVSDTALKLKLPELARGLGLKFGFVDDYDSTATTGNRNDTRLTLALTLDF